MRDYIYLYKRETGKDVFTDNGYYRNHFVSWLMKQLNDAEDNIESLHEELAGEDL